MRDKSSWRDIDVLGLPENLITKISTEESRRVEINPSAQHFRQLDLHAEKRETGRFTLLELDQHVDVAVRAKVVAQHRAEQRQTPDMVALAQLGDRRARKFDMFSNEVGSHEPNMTHQRNIGQLPGENIPDPDF